MNEPLHPLDKFHFCPVCGSARFVVNDFKSKRCADCGFVYFFNPSAATVGVIVNSRGELLVCRRANNPAKGTLDLPGGFCDCHETAEEGVAREIGEETGMKVTSVKFLFTLPDQYLYSDFLVHTVDSFFLCEVPGDACPVAADDAAELMWLPRNEVHPEAFGLASVRKGVERILEERMV